MLQMTSAVLQPRSYLEVSDHADLRALPLRALEAEPTAFGSTLERELHFEEWVWRNDSCYSSDVDGFPVAHKVRIDVGITKNFRPNTFREVSVHRLSRHGRRLREGRRGSYLSGLLMRLR
jgi:hypothetical protein